MWLIPYLFGTSPVCSVYSIFNKPSYLCYLYDHYYVGEYSTSLRMSDLGYQSRVQQQLFIQ